MCCTNCEFSDTCPDFIYDIDMCCEYCQNYAVGQGCCNLEFNELSREETISNEHIPTEEKSESELLSVGESTLNLDKYKIEIKHIK